MTDRNTTEDFLAGFCNNYSKLLKGSNKPAFLENIGDFNYETKR